MEQDAVNASKVFIDNLNEAKTRIGMETFGEAPEERTSSWLLEHSINFFRGESRIG